MLNSPQESRHSDEIIPDQKNRADLPVGGLTEAENLTQPPEGRPADEACLPIRVEIPGYEVLELLGRGGMGVVYRARQTALGRVVALKMILHAEHAGAAQRQRFQTEAEAVARLQHPNIVQVFEVGTHQGLPYLTLEYCPGGSLAQQIKGNPWPIRDAAQMVQTLALAMHAAHGAKVVHRDLNPANVLLTAEGQLKITDFGLAKKLGEPGRTQTGDVVGTPSYMSPEQAGGKAKEVGPPTDIYALGAILYELLTGRPPFQAATPLDTVLQVVADEPPPVRRLRPEVPRDLETICHKCLEKEPSNRYADAASLAEDLRHFLAGEPIRVRRISAWERGIKWAKRRPSVVVATVASFVAFVCMILLMGAVVIGGVKIKSEAELLPSSTKQGQEEEKVDTKTQDGAWVVPPQPEVPPGNPRQAVVQESSRKPAAAKKGGLTAADRERVKRATVYLRVKMPDGTQTFGSGFFGCKEARNIVLTNAHVIGMLVPVSIRPKEIEVIVNSNDVNEWSTPARVLGVDRASDLAVLDIGIPQQPLPEPLTVRSATGLQPLDEVYVFGFPFGEQLGGEITIRPASVSALRKKNGRFVCIQVNGGIDDGNSGGPLYDNNGNAVGVAVSSIAGRQRNFAIPGERIHAVLDGDISELAIQQPFFTDGNKVALPLIADMIDPRNLIKQIGLEVWTGDKPTDAKSSFRPAATTPPPAKPGDSPRVYFNLNYQAPEGKADIILPELPTDKVYWQQLKWIDGKVKTHWAAASPILSMSPPVYRKPAKLVLHYAQGSRRAVDLNVENIFKVSSHDEDADTIRIRTAARFTETVASAWQNGTTLTLTYRQPPHRELILPDGQTRSTNKDEQFINELPRLVTTSVQVDRLGTILQQVIDPRPLASIDPQQVKSIKSFQERIQQALDLLSVSLPPGGTVNPLDSWKAQRTVPIDTPGKTEQGKIDVTFTYLGKRRRDGREEAIISMDGTVRVLGKGDGIRGKADGWILVDVASGQTIRAETTAKLQLEALLSDGVKLRPIRVLAIMKFRLQRKL